MYEIRPFSNTDPPHLADIWRSQPPHRGLMQPISAGVLEQCIFAKPYFDRQGLIVATRDGKRIGFAHAAFGPNESQTGISTELGTTQVLMVRNEERDSQLGADLLTSSENYLRGRGAKVLYAGGIRPLNAFYLGLYGGSELPGILQSDPATTVFMEHGYREIDLVVILHRELANFRPLVSRNLRQLRRDVVLEEGYAISPTNWWDACSLGTFDRTRFELVSRRDKKSLASVWFWDVEPLASSWGLRTAGMLDLWVDPEYRRRGLATHLVSEAFKQLAKRGVSLIEAQTMQHNEPALALYEKLGFSRIDHGRVLRKDALPINGQPPAMDG